MIQRIINNGTRAGIETAFDHLLIAAIVQVGKEKGDRLVEAWHKGGWDIVFQVEGIDLSLKDVMDEWEKQLERMLAEKAAEIVDEKTGDLLCSLDKTITDVRHAIDKKLEETLGFKITREE